MTAGFILVGDGLTENTLTAYVQGIKIDSLMAFAYGTSFSCTDQGPLRPRKSTKVMVTEVSAQASLPAGSGS